jgi:hypothetical protein
MQYVKWLAGGLVGAAVAVTAGAGMAQDKTVRMSVVSFLSGPAAGPFGVPSRNAAELVISAINEGKLPAPYDKPGIAGAKIDVEFVDENGGNTKVVAEYRNMVEKRGTDVVVGYISSGSCAALAPVIEELKKLTIISVCGTPRIFEEAPRNYVFRTMSHATSDGVAAARYVADKFGDITSYVGINQNYAWGQDSWRDFELAMKVLKPDVAAVPGPVRHRDLGAAARQVGAGAFQLLGRRSGGVHLPGDHARAVREEEGAADGRRHGGVPARQAHAGRTDPRCPRAVRHPGAQPRQRPEQVVHPGLLRPLRHLSAGPVVPVRAVRAGGEGRL